MRALARALSAEILKIKRTLALWLALLIPLVIVMLQFFVLMNRSNSFLQDVQDPALWFGRQTIFFWALLMLPLFITLETALLCGLEHTNNHWKHLFSLPVSRFAIYMAKQAAGLLLVALSFLSLLGFIVITEILMAVIKPDFGIGFGIPIAAFLKYAAFGYAGSIILIFLHTWVGLRWRSFVVAVGFGITMTIVGLILINSNKIRLYPWTLSARILNRVKDGLSVTPELVMIGFVSLIISTIGGWIIIRRDVL